MNSGPEAATSLVIDAAGLRFSALTAGPVGGEPVVLLHGFPDHPGGFARQIEPLATAGYRVIVPTMRGYEPSSQPPDRDHSLVRLASDVLDQLDTLGIDRAHVIGHDWGAAVTYVLASMHPDRLLTATAMAVPPVARIPEALRHVPRQLRLSWYMTFFQLRLVADVALRAFHWGLLRRLWRRWSPGFDPGADYWRDLLAVFGRAGVGRSALAYYRQNATPLLLLGLRTNAAMQARDTHVPLLVLHGAEDGCMDPRLFDHTVLDADHHGGVERVTMPGVGHFLHMEAPDRVNELLLRHLGRGTPAI